MEAVKKKADSRGIIKIITPQSREYYSCSDVMELLGVSQAKAYKMIRTLRIELIKEGHLFSGYPAGKVPKRYFNERCGIG